MPRWRWIFMACIGVLIAVSLWLALQGNSSSWWLFAGMTVLFISQIWEARKATRSTTPRRNADEIH